MLGKRVPPPAATRLRSAELPAFFTSLGWPVDKIWLIDSRVGSPLDICTYRGARFVRHTYTAIDRSCKREWYVKDSS